MLNHINNVMNGSTNRHDFTQYFYESKLALPSEACDVTKGYNPSCDYTIKYDRFNRRFIPTDSIEWQHDDTPQSEKRFNEMVEECKPLFTDDGGNVHDKPICQIVRQMCWVDNAWINNETCRESIDVGSQRIEDCKKWVLNDLENHSMPTDRLATNSTNAMATNATNAMATNATNAMATNTPNNRVFIPEQDSEASITVDGFAAQQNGLVGFNKLVDYNQLNTINTPRDVIGFVHNDVLEAGFREGLDILLRSGAERNSVFSNDANLSKLNAANGLFYSETGCAFMKATIFDVIRTGLICAWNNKYSFMRIRPEVLAYYWDSMRNLQDSEHPMEADFAKELKKLMPEHYQCIKQEGGDEGVIGILGEVIDNNQSNTIKLKALFPEGSPTHASYTGGHSLAAGTQATMLKLFFNCYDSSGKFVKWKDIIGSAYSDSYNGDQSIDQYMQTEKYTTVHDTDFRNSAFIGCAENNKYVSDETAYVEVDGSSDAFDQITLVGEIHKLASQYTFSRDWGGVHYQSDGYYGMYAGQSVAIRYMQGILAGKPSTINSELDGSITFPTFDGKCVNISATEIRYNGMLVQTPEDLYPQFIKDKLLNEPNGSLAEIEY